MTKRRNTKAMLSYSLGVSGLSLDNFTPGIKTPHWKDTQSESDKKIRLRLAELKRKLKKNKKLKLPTQEFLDEIKSLKNQLKG